MNSRLDTDGFVQNVHPPVTLIWNRYQNNDSSVFTVTTESPKPGYDGLSNFRRLRMERQYTTLSMEEECEYILQPESIPNCTYRICKNFFF
jgi:hypothetical protein